MSHLQLHEQGHLDAHRLLVEKQDLDRHILGQVKARFAHLVLGEHYLLVGLVVHHMEVPALPVEILHLPLHEVRPLHFFAGTKGLIQHPPGEQALHFGAHKGPAFARLDVLKVHDGVGHAVQFNL